MRMGGLSLQRRLAAKILKVGESKIWMDKEHLEDIKNAITRADIKKMISHGYIQSKVEKPKFPKKRRKTKKGIGRRKGSKGARYSKKRKWINTIRPLRDMLKELKAQGKIDSVTYKKTYLLIKGGMFRSRAHLKLYLRQKGISV